MLLSKRQASTTSKFAVLFDMLAMIAPADEVAALLAKVQFWIAKLLERRSLAGDEVMARLASIATGDIGDFINILPETGQVFFDLRKAEELDVLHLIKRIKYVKHGPGAGGVELELHDPIRALELIGKNLGLFQDTNIKVDNYKITVVREGDKDD